MFSAHFVIHQGEWPNGEGWRYINIHVGPLLIRAFPWGDLERGVIASTRIEFRFPVMLFQCWPENTVASPLETLNQWMRRRTQRRKVLLQNAYFWRDEVGALKAKRFS